MSRLALIDGDVLLYRATAAVQSGLYVVYDRHSTPVYASTSIREVRDWYSTHLEEGQGETRHLFAIEEESWDTCKLIIKSQLDSICKACDTNDYQIYLSGKGNFRYDVYPEYKGNRTVPKPILYPIAKKLLEENIATIVVDGMEADDALGIRQFASYNHYGDDPQSTARSYKEADTIICTNDKDLLMIPGHHYNFVREEKKFVTLTEGYRSFYTQLLMGDSTDNIPGLKGIGPVKAKKLLEHCTTIEGMRLTVEKAYKEAYEDTDKDPMAIMNRNAQLIWILREEPDA